MTGVIHQACLCVQRFFNLTNHKHSPHIMKDSSKTLLDFDESLIGDIANGHNLFNYSSLAEHVDCFQCFP